MSGGTVYSQEEALKACATYFEGDEIAAHAVVNKYLLRNNAGELIEKTPDDMHDRLANEFTRVELKMNPKLDAITYRTKVRAALDKFREIVPQGSPMAAIGNPFKLQSLSNCFVIDGPTKDSMEDIFRVGHEMAELQKRRGGVGTELSDLRPIGAHVNNAAKYSGGVTTFSDFFSHITRMVGQFGRQGATMLTFNVKHPDADKFATMKHDRTKVTGANVSIKITDEFMLAVKNDTEYRQQWPVCGVPKIEKTIKARNLWDTIVNSAYLDAEPGLLMWDTYVRECPASYYDGFYPTSTNPCSELLLCPYDSCRLISMNLSGFVKNPFTSKAEFDFETYAAQVKLAQRMSDGLVELEIEAVEKIISTCELGSAQHSLWSKILDKAKLGRRTGLGTHGLADVFLKLCIKYDSKAALKVSDAIYSVHRNSSYQESITMARERGHFSIWNKDIDMKCPFIDRLPEELRLQMQMFGRRNIANLTNAPTGTTSIQSKTSSGIEPVFAWVYDRFVKINSSNPDVPVARVDECGDRWSRFRIIHPAVLEYFTVHGIECPIESGFKTSIALDKANKTIAKSLPEYFVSSSDIDYMEGVKLQAVITKYIDHGLSKTINMPKGSTKEQVSELYMKAWELGLKGVTVYVDGSRDGVLISSDTVVDNRPKIIADAHAPKRPKDLDADIHHVSIGGKSWAVVIGLMDNRPYEVFSGRGLILPRANKIEYATITKDKPKKYSLKMKIVDNGIDEVSDLTEIYDNDEQRVITRAVCTQLRHGIPVEFIINALKDNEGSMYTYSAVLARVLKKYATKATYMVKHCSECKGTNMALVDGCVSCNDCGSSKCE